MAARGLGGLLLYASGQHNMLRMDQVRYLTDYRCWARAALVVPPKGRRACGDPCWDLARAREVTWLAAVDACRPEEPSPPRRRLTVDLRTARPGRPRRVSRRLRRRPGRALGGRPSTPTTCALAARAHVGRAGAPRRAAAIADEGFRASASGAGRPARVRAGRRGRGRHAGPARRQFRADRRRATTSPSGRPGPRAGARRRGYRRDHALRRGLLRAALPHLVLGEPTPLQQEKYALLMEANAAGLAATRPGLPAADIAQARSTACISAAGYAEYCRPPYMRTRGHSLGLGAVVPYDLTEEASPIFQRRDDLRSSTQPVPARDRLHDAGRHRGVGDAGPRR